MGDPRLDARRALRRVVGRDEPGGARALGAPAPSTASDRDVRGGAGRTTTRTITDAQGNVSTETSEQRERVEVPVPLVASDIAVELDLEHRRRGLVWFPTYAVDFRGRYTFQNPDDQGREITIAFPLQGENATYDGFVVRDAAGETIETEIGPSATWRVSVGPRERATYEVAYRSRGTGTWHYGTAFGTSRVTDFRLAMTTDFADVDFPAGTLSPTEHGPTADGWRGVWRFDSLIANQPIGIEPPSRVNPGPLASRITFFAPVGLLFFFFVVAVLGSSQRRELHPVHFFFLGCAFFAFHLLFAYLVDHLSIALSFGSSTAVSMLLVVTYARFFVGWRFALREMALAQLIYLVLFSAPTVIAQLIYLVLFSATFLIEGFTGLAITVGAILTLFVMMQITGRARRRDAGAPAPMPPSGSIPREF